MLTNIMYTVVARDDAAITDATTGDVLVDILANDVKPDMNKRYISGVTITSQPQYGTASIVEEDGTYKLQYQETTIGDTQADSITYTLALTAAAGQTSSSMAGDQLSATVAINKIQEKTTFIISDISTNWCKSDEVTVNVTDSDKLAKVVITDENGKVILQEIAPNAAVVTLKPTLTANGTYTITATDLLGNVETETFIITKVDNSAPTVDLSGITTQEDVDHDDNYDTPNKDVIAGIVAEDESIANVTVKLPIGNGITVTVTPDGNGGYTVTTEGCNDSENVTVDENGAIHVTIPDTNANTDQDDGKDTSATVIFKPTTNGKDLTSCEVDLVLPTGTDTSKVVISVEDSATLDAGGSSTDANKTDFALVDIIAPTYVIDRAVEQKVYYLPVSIDVTDQKNATELGAIRSIVDKDATQESVPTTGNRITLETNLLRTPAKATFVVESLKEAYKTGATNQVTRTVVTTDTYGNTQEIEITMGAIPTVESITRENHEELKDIIAQIEKELATEGMTSFPATFDADALKQGLEDVLTAIAQVETITDTTEQTQEITYNNTAQSPILPTGENVWGDTTADSDKITIKYSNNHGKAYSDTDTITYTEDKMPAFTNAGTYYVYYEMSSANCKPTVGMITYTINKMQLTWNQNGSVADKVYDGTTATTITTAPTLNVIVGDKIPEITVGEVRFADANVSLMNSNSGMQKAGMQQAGMQGEGVQVLATGYTVAESENYLAPQEQPTFANAKIRKA